MMINQSYSITESGDVVNVKTGKLKSKWVGNNGYYIVSLGRNNSKLLHRLLAEAFIPNPDKKPTVNHKDGNKLNNDLSNLEWATHKEQIDHKRVVLCKTGGEFKAGSKGKDSAKRKPIIAIFPDGLVKMFYGASEASRELGLGRTVIKNYLNGYVKNLKCGVKFQFVNQ